MGKRIYGVEVEGGDAGVMGLTLKEAVAQVREYGGKVLVEAGAEPVIMDADIDPYDHKYDTKEELRAQLEEHQRRAADARHAAAAAVKARETQEHNLVDAGLIPIHLLGAFITQATLRSEPSHHWGSNTSLRAPTEQTMALELAVPAPGTPAKHAMEALMNYRRNQGT